MCFTPFGAVIPPFMWPQVFMKGAQVSKTVSGTRIESSTNLEALTGHFKC